MYPCIPPLSLIQWYSNVVPSLSAHQIFIAYSMKNRWGKSGSKRQDAASRDVTNVTSQISLAPMNFVPTHQSLKRPQIQELLLVKLYGHPYSYLSEKRYLYVRVKEFQKLHQTMAHLCCSQFDCEAVLVYA